MDRIRQALDRARFERAFWECAPPQRTLAVPSALSTDVARVRFEPLPAPEIDALELAEFADVPANSQASDADLESAPLQSECSVRSEDPPATVCERDQAHAEGEAQAAVQYPQGGRQQVESFSLDRSAHRGGSRLSGHAPLIVSLILGGLITVELAHASLLLLGAGPSKTQGPPQAPGVRAPQRHAFDVNGIIAAHLFGEAALPGTQDAAVAKPTSANLLLAGTLAMEDPRHGLAIITNDGRSKAYRVGDTVADGELHSVFRDHVLLRRRGLLESLVFPRLRLAKESTKDSNRQPAQPARTDTEMEASSAQRGALDVMRAEPSPTLTGKLRGFRIFPSTNAELFDASGLKAGEIVVAVNGASLVDQDRETGQQIFDSIKTSSRATLSVVDRDGTMRDVTIDTAQANSAKATPPADQ